MQGYVCIFDNRALPGQLKIGWTNLSPEHRAGQLSGPSVPSPFRVLDHVLVSDCTRVKRLLADALSPYRANKKGDFYAVDSITAINALRRIAREYQCKTNDAHPVTTQRSGSITHTISLTPKCPQCKTRYKVTMRRHEAHSVCPKCRHRHPVTVDWS